MRILDSEIAALYEKATPEQRVRLYPAVVALNKKIRRRLPTALYRYFDKDGALLYVGISLSAVVRLHGHKQKAAPWFDDIVTIKIERLPSRSAALTAELKAIKTERPRYNVAGKR